MTGNEWTWGGAFVRLVVVVLILAALNAGQARSMLDKPDAQPAQAGASLADRP